MWNWYVPALWNRFVVELVRAIARKAGLPNARCELVRVAYVKVAEFQRRGLVHLHAIVRLDAPDDRADASGLNVTGDELADTIREAGQRASFDGDHGNGGSVLVRFGEQLKPVSCTTATSRSASSDPSRSPRTSRSTPARAHTSRSRAAAPRLPNCATTASLSSSCRRR